MEARPTRRALRAFPLDLQFTQDPKDPLRQMLDLPGRQAMLASEYMRDQLHNLHLGTADSNEPRVLYASGMVVPLGASLAGNFLNDAQDLVTMRVTGFDYVETLRPSGLSPSEYYGIAYAQESDGSGVLYLTIADNPYIYRYNWETLSEIDSSGITGVVSQNFDTQLTDEYLVIERDTDYGIIAELKHTPRAKPRLIDSKNLAAPWAPEISDGIEADPDEITVSGNFLILQDPRPSYNPPTASGDTYIYPENHQPDRHWMSSFIAEYEYDTKEYPYGLSPATVRHHMGIIGTPLTGADDA